MPANRQQQAAFDKLKASQASMSTQLDWFIDKYDNFQVTDEATFQELSLIKAKVESISAKYESNHAALVDHSEEDDTAYFRFFQIFIPFLAKVNASLKGYTCQQEQQSHAASTAPLPVATQPVQPTFRLPEIPMPEFSGSFQLWREFKTSFTSIIIDQPSVSDAMKLRYLKQSLSGEALARIQNIAAGDDNFKIAWRLLEERYENPRLIASSHVFALDNPPTIKKNCAQSLRAYIDHNKSNIEALEALKLGIEVKDLIYSHKILSHLDQSTLRDWEKRSSFNKIPSLDSLWEFLETQCKVWEAMSANNNSQPAQKLPQKPQNNSNTHQNSNQSNSRQFNTRSNFQTSQVITHNGSSNQNSNQGISCLFCQGQSHTVFKCEALLNLQPSARLDSIKSRKLCFNCLKPYNVNHTCSTKNCHQCGKRHHTLLHDSFSSIKVKDQVISNAIQSNSNQAKSDNSQQDNLPSLQFIPSNRQSLPSAFDSNSSQPVTVHSNVASGISSFKQSFISVMPTAEIFVKDQYGCSIPVTALLDSGSDCNLISHELAVKLNLPPVHIETQIHSVCSNKSKSSISHCVTVESIDHTWSSQQSCIVVAQISPAIPSSKIDLCNFTIPDNIKLADSKFHQSKKIDILLGVGVFASILSFGQITTNPGSLVIQNSKLGWIIFGNCETTSSNCESFDKVISNFVTTSVSDQLERFWKLEEVSNVVPMSAECAAVEEHYNKHTIRQDDGRFIVSLPRRENFHALGNSEFQATNRFYALERRFAKNPELQEQYKDFMQEYESLGHMSIAPPLEPNQKAYFIPHHAVLKPDSTTTRLRVVFDASAKSTTGLSLNDALHVGPVVQPELFDIVLCFRTHPIAYTADVAKMYRQILLHPNDRDFHRIVWRDHPSKPLLQYRLNTVTYGTAPAAFLATRTLNKLAELEVDSDTLLFKTITQDFYVDDLISGCSDSQQAIELANQLISVLKKGGFQLRKWMSNSQELLNSIPSELIEPATSKEVTNSADNCTKALGLIWNSSTDTLSISSNVLQISNQTSFTKRQFLACIASIFDPLGLIAPVVILPKILFQKLWLLKIGWDDSLPTDLLNQWLKMLQELPKIAEISIPRCIISGSSNVAIELHGFSDASLAAYGACVYIRTVSINDEIHVQPLSSKSRVAPLKPLSVPKLELCAALLLSRLVNKIVKASKLQFSGVYLWSDSKTVCDWIKNSPDRKNVFVSVRIGEIQETTSDFSWNHVKTADNPADVLSRGCTPQELIDHRLWWSGPRWLSMPSSSWSSVSSNILVSCVSNTLVSNVNPPKVSVLSQIISKFSEYHKMVRSTAFLLRFIHNSRNSIENRHTGFPSIDELSNAELQLVKVVQMEAFPTDLNHLVRDEELSSNSSLKNLAPFLHSDGIIRVGGRLENAKIPFEYKHQIVLPSKHKFVKALVIATHLRLLHAGVQLTMAAIRQKYWIVSTRRTVKSILRTCLKCFRFTHSKAEQLMGQLPAVRVNIDFPFYNCGVDYAGPISIRIGGPRSRTFVKAYLALFVCMVTRAVHVEVVTEASSKAFIAALSRFVSRRGIPKTIYSDNATTFHGANNELQELSDFLASSQNQKEIQCKASAFNIQWSFIPPRAPHFGGLWENAIKNFKSIFKVITLNQILNLEELFTLSTQIEAILNSRPIVPLTEDPTDLSYLSPGHFIIGRPLNALPFKPSNTKHTNYLSRWLLLSSLTQKLWDRWSEEYLVTLQKRHKWTAVSDNISIGTLVLLKDLGTPPATWKIGRIVQAFPGADKKVRVVMVRTSEGTYKRPISSIAPLPLEDSE